MKRATLEAGQIYTNGKGRFRLLVAFGGYEYRLYNGQVDTDNLLYHGWKTLKRGLAPMAGHWNCRERGFGEFGRPSTVESFATWVKREATPEEVAAIFAAGAELESPKEEA